MILSRHMPKNPPPTRGDRIRLRIKICFAVLLYFGIYGFLTCYMIVSVFAGSFFAAAAVGLLFILHFLPQDTQDKTLNRLRGCRQGEDIGTFVHALPIRDLDAWIVRATYEELSADLKTGKEPFPLRPTDRFDDLWIEMDYLEDGLLPAIAARCQRSLTDLEKNPRVQTVETVEDLIQMLMLQPKVTIAEPTTASQLPQLAG